MAEKKQYDILDVSKFVFSIFVVGIHTLDKYGIYPLFRIAVPMFFLMSSYLFFSKLNNDRIENIQLLKKFCARNIKLYIFWFLLLFPFWGRSYLSGNIGHNIIVLAVRFFFGSTFPASWYIMSLVIGTIIVFWFRKIIGLKVRVFLALIVYVLCCLASNYRGLFFDHSLLLKVVFLYPGTIYNSFPIAFVWISLGEMLVEIRHSKRFRVLCISARRKRLIFYVCFVLLLFEAWMINKVGCSVDNDCYFLLAPTCMILLDILLSINIEKKYAVCLRKLSTIIYCTHGTIASLIIGRFIENKGLISCYAAFGATLALSISVGIIFLLLETKKCFKWLKWAH